VLPIVVFLLQVCCLRYLYDFVPNSGLMLSYLSNLQSGEYLIKS